MFGYIGIDKAELKFKDYDRFCGYYCGLCRKLKRDYSIKSSFTLSNDCVFLYLLISAITDKEETVSYKTCPLHPFKKKLFISSSGEDFASAVNILLFYNKLADDIRDDGSKLSNTLKVLYKKEYKKATEKYPKLYDIIKENSEKLTKLEAEKCFEIDMVSDVFAGMLGSMFAEISDVDSVNLYEIGYSIGKWIYLIDAYDDMQKDKEKQRYNIFNLIESNSSDKSIRTIAEYSLNASANNAVRAFNRLDVLKDKVILENILENSVFKRTQLILNGRKNERK